MSPSHDAAIPNWRRHRSRKGGLSLPSSARPPLLPSFFPSSYELAHAEGGAEYVVRLFDMHFIAPHGGMSMSSSVHMHTQCNPATISLSEIGLLGA